MVSFFAEATGFPRVCGYLFLKRMSMIYFPRAAHFYFLIVSILTAVFQTTS